MAKARRSSASLQLSTTTLIALLSGCGAGAPPPPARSAVGAEPSAHAPEAPPQVAEAEPAQEPAPASGPASLTVDARVHGKSVAASVELFGPDGQEAASGQAGSAIATQSGDYEMKVTITDASALVDKPSQRQALTLRPGDALQQVVDFPWAMIQLNVVINGRPEANASVRLLRQGAEVTTLKSGGDFVPISPGKYEAEVKAQGASIPVHGLMFPEGATQTVPVNVAM